jgi:hypothetical protein
MQHGFARVTPVEKLLGYTGNLGPGGFDTNVRPQLARRHQAGEARQAV